MKGCVTLVLLFIMLPGCLPRLGPSQSPTALRLPVTEIELPVDGAITAAWLKDALVVARSGSHRYDHTLWRIPHDNPEGYHQLQLPPHSSCGPDGLNGFYRPARLADGRLSYIVDCRPNTDNLNEMHMHMMVLDPVSLESEQLLPYELPGPILPSISWKADMSEGMAYKNNGLNAWVFRVTRDQWYPLDLGFTQVSGLDWSPDRTTIAFLAAPEQGLDGLARADARFNLYLIRPDGANLRLILDDLYQPAHLLWSADGRWLLFNGTIDRTVGVWAFNVTNDELHLILEKWGGAFSWLPDGRRLLVLQQSEAKAGNSQLEPQTVAKIYDLGALFDGEIP